MFREIKYFLYLLIIILFLFLSGSYYFSDLNKKNSFRSLNNLENKIDEYSDKLPIIESDTEDIIEYADISKEKKKKKFQFWKLLD
tara:strand:+ start:271 stop:525 length:255 start_codon:yes stop_codon:yes gene_type:complete